jgi:hypothetical protein
MHTSYFAKYRNKPNGVSIALYPPKGFTGRLYTKLAPPPWLFVRFKTMILNGRTDEAEEWYVETYQAEVLDKLDPHQVLEELGEDAVVLCYEAKNEDGTPKFCHRHLFAKWLHEHTGVEITELD